jgi:hypothetical protein
MLPPSTTARAPTAAHPDAPAEARPDDLAVAPPDRSWIQASRTLRPMRSSLLSVHVPAARRAGHRTVTRRGAHPEAHGLLIRCPDMA